jgi:anti-anti-sigma factor
MPNSPGRNQSDSAGFTLLAMQDSQATFSSRAGAHPRTLIVQVDGPFTLPNIFNFQAKVAFLKAHEVIVALIVDVTGVPYMDSAGLGCIINLYVSAEKNDQKFFLAGANDRVTALLETAKVHRLIRSYPTVDDVEATLRG